MRLLSLSCPVLVIMVLTLLWRSVDMANSNGVAEETDRLLAVLNADEVPPHLLEAGLPDFSVASKNELVARVARTFAPAPSGRLLARLQFILTDQNKPDMVTAYVVNLRSPQAEARKFSLYGLQQLEHPALTDLALLSLRDDNDEVLFAACHILLPQARQEARLWKILQGVYAVHQGQKKFYMSMSLLEGHGIEGPPPEAE